MQSSRRLPAISPHHPHEQLHSRSPSDIKKPRPHRRPQLHLCHKLSQIKPQRLPNLVPRDRKVRRGLVQQTHVLVRVWWGLRRGSRADISHGAGARRGRREGVDCDWGGVGTGDGGGLAAGLETCDEGVEVGAPPTGGGVLEI